MSILQQIYFILAIFFVICIILFAIQVVQDAAGKMQSWIRFLRQRRRRRQFDASRVVFSGQIWRVRGRPVQVVEVEKGVIQVTPVVYGHGRGLLETSQVQAWTRTAWREAILKGQIQHQEG